MTYALQPAAAAGLKQWHAIVANGDMAALGALLHPDATFWSPTAHTPFEGSFALALALSTVFDVFEDFTYHGEYAAQDGRRVILEFSALVGAKKVKGIDLITFDEHGKIIEFEVMVRPKSGLDALAAEMTSRIGAQMVKMKRGVS